MISNRMALLAVLKDGDTICRLNAEHQKWTLVRTDEPVHGAAVKAALRRSELRQVQAEWADRFGVAALNALDEMFERCRKYGRF